MINISTIAATTAIIPAVNTPINYNKFRRIQAILGRFSLPYLIIVTGIGLITNTATIVLLSKSSVTKNLRHKWTLIALALSDLLFNIALLIRIIHHDFMRGNIEYLCMLISSLSHLAELLSACFIVLFTIQRYTAVRYPIQAAIQKRSSPFITLLIISLASIIFCTILSYSNKHADCHEELKLSWFIADALSSFIIPFSLILILNILIVNAIRQHARSPMSTQSTLRGSGKRVKNGTQSKSNPFDETCSYGNSHTLHGTMSDVEPEGKLHSTSSSVKSVENNRRTSLHNPTKEALVPMLTIEQANEANSSNNHSQSCSQYDLKKKNERRTSHSSNDVDFASNKFSQTTQSIRVTRMLVIVSTCFLILNAPAHLCVIATKIYTEINAQIYHEHSELEYFKQTKNLTNNQLKNYVFIKTNDDNKKNSSNANNHLITDDVEFVDDQIMVHLFYIIVSITQSISYASYSINFFLYSYSGVAFRTSLKQWFTKIRLY